MNEAPGSKLGLWIDHCVLSGYVQAEKNSFIFCCKRPHIYASKNMHGYTNPGGMGPKNDFKESRKFHAYVIDESEKVIQSRK